MLVTDYVGEKIRESIFFGFLLFAFLSMNEFPTRFAVRGITRVELLLLKSRPEATVLADDSLGLHSRESSGKELTLKYSTSLSINLYSI